MWQKVGRGQVQAVNVISCAASRWRHADCCCLASSRASSLLTQACMAPLIYTHVQTGGQLNWYKCMQVPQRAASHACSRPL